MKKSDAVKHYGTARKLASAVGLTEAAVSMWGEYVPLGRAYQIQALTKNKLKVELPEDETK